MKYTKDITLIALLTVILFLQEQILSFIPNVQLTVFFFVLYSKKLDFVKTILIVIIYVILDNIIGGFNLLFLPFMLLGWLIIPMLINTVFKKVESNIYLALLGILFSLIYSWINIIPGCIMFNMDFITYLKGDLIWEITLASSSFLTILLLYNPCSKLFDRYITKKGISN